MKSVISWDFDILDKNYFSCYWYVSRPERIWGFEKKKSYAKYFYLKTVGVIVLSPILLPKLIFYSGLQTWLQIQPSILKQKSANCDIKIIHAAF